jgi:hypothetical protein
MPFSIKFSEDDLYNEQDIRPSLDSDGGGDYVDNVDSLEAAKFNVRFNSIEEFKRVVEEFTQNVRRNVSRKYDFGFFRKEPTTWDSILQPDSTRPFWHEIDGMNFRLRGNSSTYNSQAGEDIVLPLAIFIDTITEGGALLNVLSGSSDLIEFQEDYSGAPDEARWYRLGHTGGEITPEQVTCGIDLTAQPAADRAYPSFELRFSTGTLPPSGYKQGFRIAASTLNNEKIELIIDPDETNFILGVAAWDGGTLQTHTIDSGIAASGYHCLQAYCLEDEVVVYVDSTLVYQSAGAEWIERVDTIEWFSDNDAGGADYVDLYRFDVYSTKIETLVDDNVYYAYLEQDVSDKYTYRLEVDSTRPTGNQRILYVIDVPSGAGSLTDDMISDLRYNDVFQKNSIVEKLNVLGTLVAGTMLITDLNVNTLNADVANIEANYPKVTSDRIFYANQYGASRTDVELQAAIDATNAAGGGVVVITGTWTLGAIVNVYDNITIVGAGATVQGNDLELDSVENVLIKNLRLTGNGRIRCINGSKFCFVRDIYAFDITGNDAIEFNTCIGCHVEGFYSNSITSSNKHLIHFNGCNYCSMSKIYYAGNGTYTNMNSTVFGIRSGCTHCTIRDVYIVDQTNSIGILESTYSNLEGVHINWESDNPGYDVVGIVLRNADDCTIQGALLEIDYGDSVTPALYGIYVTENCENLHIIDSKLYLRQIVAPRTVFGIYFTKGGGTTLCDSVIISNCIIETENYGGCNGIYMNTGLFGGDTYTVNAILVSGCRINAGNCIDWGDIGYVTNSLSISNIMSNSTGDLGQGDDGGTAHRHNVTG